MLAPFALTARTRTDFGKAASRRLRRLGGKTPAILYGGGKPPVALVLDHAELVQALEKPAFYSHILTISIDGVPQQAVLKGPPQRHPVKPEILHADFLRISAQETITLSVPLRFKGEALAPGVKQEGGIVSHLLNSIEVSCLPDRLPEHLDVDLSQLGLNETLTLSQLVLPEGVELVALKHGDDKAIVTIHLPRVHTEDESGKITENATPTSAD